MMKFEEIEVGAVYRVNYVDPNYPCKCDCHRPGSTMVHCMPCCWDASYCGFATCLGAFDDGKSHLYATDRRRFLRLEAERSVLEAAGDEQPIAIDARITAYVEAVLGVEDE